ncbi:MAG: M1 family metallopeptidase [Anaerolineales bacterium]|nr:M1 family metallopeptidase [Anaerolineales bacterium]
MQKSLRLFSWLFLLSILTACGSPAPAPEPTQTATLSPTIAPPTETAIIPTDQPTATPIPAPERATYTINAALDYAAKTVSVDQTILYPNHSGETLPNLVLAVVPNMWPGSFNLSALGVDGTPITNYILQGQKLEFALPAPLAPETTVTVALQYTLILPFAEQQDPSVERPRIYGYTARQVNLANWYPFIVPYAAGKGWVLHDPWYYGEHLVYEAADYEVNLTTDPSVVVAASGYAEPNGEWTRYTLQAGRAFAVSASPEYLVSTMQVEDVTVYSYYFPLYDIPGQAALSASAQALQIYSQRFAPYPHNTLSIVMGDFNDGMEYSAFYFHSRAIYNSYDGTPNNYLTTVAVHETAHQWWFERVANDQAENPWLDESLCTYSERIYYETASPDSLQQWWWPVRIDFYQPHGFIDSPTNSVGTEDEYWSIVYFNGVHFLEDLRARTGDEAFFAFLGDYAAQMDGKIATPQDFFAILRQHTSADFSDLIATYFTNSY